MQTYLVLEVKKGNPLYIFVYVYSIRSLRALDYFSVAKIIPQVF